MKDVAVWYSRGQPHNDFLLPQNLGICGLRVVVALVVAVTLLPPCCVAVSGPGDVYDGPMRGVQRWGEGVLVTSAGVTYKGVFEADELEGVGEILSPTWTYKGRVTKSRPHVRSQGSVQVLVTIATSRAVTFNVVVAWCCCDPVRPCAGARGMRVPEPRSVRG